MSTTTPINGLTIPALGDTQNIETATHPFLDGLDSRVIPKYASVVERNNSIQSPTNGQMCCVTETGELYKYNGTAWISAAPRFKLKRNQTQFLTGTTAAALDDQLFINLEGGSSYEYIANISYFSPAAVHIQLGCQLPPGASGRVNVSYIQNVGGFLQLGSYDITFPVNAFSDNANAHAAFYNGIVNTAAQAGTLQITFAPLASSAGGTYITTGSWIQLTKIA